MASAAAPPGLTARALHGPAGAFVDTVVAPRAGGPPSTLGVALAPPAADPRSRNAAAAEAVEEDMVATMQELRLGVVQRNQELDEQLAAVLARAEAARAQLRTVVTPAREANTAAQRARLEASLRELEAELSGAGAARFAQTVDSLLPIRHALEEAERVEQRFYAQEVPAKNEAQCGAAIRTMRQEREGMALDAAAAVAREKKIAERLEAHFAHFRRRAAAEVDDRRAQHARWEAQFAADTAAMEASHTKLRDALPPQLAGLGAATAAETEARRRADALFLDAMAASMGRLRAEALTNFGEEGEDEEGSAEGGGGGGGGGGGAGEAKSEAKR